MRQAVLLGLLGLQTFGPAGERKLSDATRNVVLQAMADGVVPGNDYPQLSAEYLVKAGPEVVVLADTTCCGESAETFAAATGRTYSTTPPPVTRARCCRLTSRDVGCPALTVASAWYISNAGCDAMTVYVPGAVGSV